MNTFDVGVIYFALALSVGYSVRGWMNTEEAKAIDGPPSLGVAIDVLLGIVAGDALVYMAFATWFGWWPR